MCSSALSGGRELIIVLLFLDLTLARWSASGEHESFICETEKDEKITILWELENEPNKIPLFLCQIIFNTNKCDAYDDQVVANYTARIMSNSTNLISILTITSISPLEHKTKLWCMLGTTKELIKQYVLKVFASAENPICDQVSLTNESRIAIKCRTEKVFPESICFFYMETNNTTEINIKEQPISYTHEQNATTGYYKTNCIYTVSADVIGPGYHMFRVVMYPNISSGLNVGNNKTSQYTTPIYLGYPKADLTECQVKGFIKENVWSNCTCYDNNTRSILPTKISWSNRLSSTRGKLEFLAKRNESYTCTISNNLNWRNTIIFQPSISYPPDMLSVTISKEIVDVCNGTNIAISGTCLVSESNPEPYVYVNINNLIEDITLLKLNGAYLFNITKITPGILNISCFANSTEYYSNASKKTTVTIKGPPDKPLIFKNDNSETNSHSNNVLEVRHGDFINCQSTGGYPLPKNLSLACGDEKNLTKNQDQVSLILNISNKTNGFCECIVWHDSDCLQKRTRIMLTFSENLPVIEQNFEKFYLGIGVAAGCIVVIITLIFIFSNLYRSQLKKGPSSLADKLVNNEDVYFMTKEINGIVFSIYPEYTNVVTTMSSAMEAPKNLKRKGTQQDTHD